MSGAVRFGVLGPLAVWRDGELVTPRGATPRVLLGALLLADGLTVSTAALVEAIWPGGAPSNPRLSVQVAVSRLRAWLDGIGAEAVIAFDGAGYRLDVPADASDLARFRALHAAAEEARPDKRVALLVEALRQWRGPVIGDGPDTLRDGPGPAALERLRCGVATELAEAALAAGEPAAAVPYVEQLAHEHPLDEPLHAALALVVAGCGRQADALAALDAIKARLADELGVDPGPALRQAHLRVLRQDVQRDERSPAEGPGWRGPEGHVAVLIGRSAQERELAGLLAHRRLVTVLGPGGCGKTTLAMFVARQVADRFADGVSVVPLASLSSADEIVMALGALLDAGAPTVDQVRLTLAHALRERRMLLVLDNCEHLSAESAGVVRWLLGVAPNVTILATSRQPLLVPDEVVAPLEPLGVPVPGLAVDPSTASVALFLRRAKEALPSFRASPEDLEVIGRVCRRLDGLPLALELAAARVRALTVSQLAARLESSLDVLGDRGGGREPRHATLRSTVDWSFQLLDEAERRLLARLSVFGDSFTVEAAEAVCADDALPADDVLLVLVSLVDKSLVTPYDVRGGRRFRLLAAVAELAKERLGQSGGVADRHLDYWLAQARAVDGRAAYNERAAICRGLAPDIGNIRAALHHGLATGRAADVAEVLARMFTVWMVNGAYLGEGEALLTRALADDAVSPEVRAISANWMAALHSMRDDYVGAREVWRGAIGDLARYGRVREHATGHIGTITYGSYLLDPAAVHELPEMFAAVGDQPTADEPSTALTAGGAVLAKWGRYAEAAELCRRYAVRSARRGTAYSASQEVLRLEVALGLGDLAEARLRREILLERLHQIDDPPEREPARRAIVVYHLAVGEPAQARDFAAAAISDLRRLLPPGMTRDAHLLILYAEALRRAGDVDGARAPLLEGLSRSLGGSRFHTGVPGVLAAALLAASTGQDSAARELAGRWDSVNRSLGLPLPLGFEEAAVEELALDPALPQLPAAGGWDARVLHELVERAHAWCAAPS